MALNPLIPNLPPQNQELLTIVKTPQGAKYYMHDAWHTFFSQFTTNLQNNFSNEGIILPNQSTANIQTLVNSITPNNNAKNNTFIVNNQTHALQVILNGVLKTVTVS